MNHIKQRHDALSVSKLGRQAGSMRLSMTMHQGRSAKEGGLYVSSVCQSTTLQCLVWPSIQAVAQVLVHSHWAQRVGHQWQQAGTPLQHSRTVASEHAETSSSMKEML